MYSSQPSAWMQLFPHQQTKICTMQFCNDVATSMPSLFYMFFLQMCVQLHHYHTSISGLVAQYIVAIDVARERFPADAYTGSYVFMW